MDVSTMVITGITAWVLASGPVALLLGRLMRRSSGQLPVAAGAVDVPGTRTLATAAR